MAMIAAPPRPYRKPESLSPASPKLRPEVRPETATSSAAAIGPVTGCAQPGP